LVPGKFVGHPGGFRWYEQAKDVLGNAPVEPESPSRSLTQADRIPEFEIPVVMFPYDKMGKSASGVTCDVSGGKFGPFHGQLFVSDQSASTVMRVYLEKIQGHYQGAVFPFRAGLASGNVATEILPSGAMIVGGTNRGWGSVGPKPFALERIDWTGKVPFEMQEMHALPDGFELKFTQPVDIKLASDVGSYAMTTYTYIYQSSYGSPEVDHTTPKIQSAKVSSDGMSVRLQVEGLQRGHVHELHANVKNETGLPLLHEVAYYTLNYLPDAASK
jgi:hypothetical protein